VIDRLIDIFIGRAIEDADRAALINSLSDGDPQASITSGSPRLRAVLGAVAASPYVHWR
jgi:hypothetical protein